MKLEKDKIEEGGILKDILNTEEELNKLKSIHPKIQQVIDTNRRAIKELMIPLVQTTSDMTDFRNQIEEETKSEMYGDIYENIPLVSFIFPNFKREIGNFMTLKQKQESNLIRFIKEIIEASNEIKKEIIYKPSEKNKSSEPERIAFENKQREEILAMEDSNSKADFYSIKHKLTKRITDEEEQKITDAVSLNIFGKKIGDVEWMIGGMKRRKKKK